jgi:hypothetical protein
VVAFSSSRRKPLVRQLPQQATVEALAACRIADPASGAAASRRDAGNVDVHRNRDGSITCLRIGRWRILTAAPQRRIAEVKELACERIAVRIERFADNGNRPSSEIWQLYDLDGRLEAAMQTTPDGKFALLSNYQTRQACRLVRNHRNELEAVETWNI